MIQTILVGVIALCSIILLYRSFSPRLDIGNDGMVYLWYNGNEGRIWKHIADISDTKLHKLIIWYKTKGKWKSKF